MLVLRRLCGQSIVIGKKAEIIVKVLRNENGTISIGVDAPKSVQIDRLEMYEKRLNDSVISVDDKDHLLGRLQIFNKRLKNSRASNEPFMNHDALPN